LNATYFPSPGAFRDWLEANHATATELVVGFHKRQTGAPSLTWAQSVDQALCFGWIDGVRRRVDDDRYVIRFTPRRRGSRWSDVNTRRFEELAEAGLVHPAGRAAFDARDPARTAEYSYEARRRPLPPDYEERLRADAAAWAFWQAQPPGYRRTAAWWVVSAKREDTRARRLATLIEDSRAGRRIGAIPGQRQAET
jgi:uncharacterized protein YdeI (YjbR/CyaY-like superfamily)